MVKDYGQIVQSALNKSEKESSKLDSLRKVSYKIKYGNEKHEVALTILKRARGRGNNWKVESVHNLSRTTKLKGAS